MHITKRFLKDLFPPGPFWEIETGSIFDYLINCIAKEAKNLINRTAQVFNYNSDREYQLELSKKISEPVGIIPTLLNKRNPLTKKVWIELLHGYNFKNVAILDTSDAQTVTNDGVKVITFLVKDAKINRARPGIEAGSRVSDFEDQNLERLINRLKPAIVLAQVRYMSGESCNFVSLLK